MWTTIGSVQTHILFKKGHGVIESSYFSIETLLKAHCHLITEQQMG